MCRRLANDLFAHEDLRAHARGWTVEPIHHSTGRRYRDPRWDRLSACQHCDGVGYRGIDTCPACAGCGVLDNMAIPAVGNAQIEDRTPLKVTAERLDEEP